VKRLLMAMTLAMGVVAMTVGAAQAAFSGLPSTSVDTGWPEGPTEMDETLRRVQAIGGSQTHIFVGGGFSTFGGSTRDHFAVITKSTETLHSFAPDVNSSAADPKNYIRDIAAEAGTDGDVWIGGDIDDVDSTSISGNVAKFDYNSGTGNFTLDTNFDAPAEITDQVRALDKTQDGLYVGSDDGIYLLDEDTGAEIWMVEVDQSVSAPVRGLDANTERVLVGGDFRELTSPVNGLKSRDLAATLLPADGTIRTNFDPTWPAVGGCSAPCLPGDLNVMAVAISQDDGHLVLAADGSGSQNGNRVIMFDVGGADPDDWECTATPEGDNGDHQAVAVTNDYIFAGHHGRGDYTVDDDDAKINVVDIDDCTDADWQPTTAFGSTSGVFAAFVDDNNLYYGGSSTTPRKSLSVFNDVP
jgi:hypothetical protein